MANCIEIYTHDGDNNNSLINLMNISIINFIVLKSDSYRHVSTF